MIKRLDDMQKYLYKDIIITIILIIISIPLWIFFDSHNISKIVIDNNDYNYINYQELNNPKYLIEPMSDIEGLHFVETKDIIVSNYSNTEDEYYLILKTNNVISNNTRININNKVEYLNSYDKVIKNEGIYYILDYETIVASSQKYVVSLWNSEESNEENISFDISIVNSI